MADDVISSNIQSILDGAGSFFFGYGFKKSVGMLTTLVLAKLLTIDSFGLLTFGFTIIGIGSLFAKLGSEKSLLKLIPKYTNDPKRKNTITTIAIVVIFVGSVGVAASLIWFAPMINRLSVDSDNFPVVLRLLSVVMILEVFIDSCGSLLRSLKRPRHQILVKDLIKPVSRNGAILLALFLGYSILGITVALVVGFGIGLVISIIVIRKAGDVALSMNMSRNDITEFLRFSIPLTIQDSGSILYKQVDILMIGFLLVSADVSFFKIATVSTVYLILPLQALSQMFVPIASELYENNNIKELERLYHIVSRWTLTASLFPATAVIMFRKELLTLFGSEYTAASFLVVIFVFRGMIVNITGPSGQLLVMTNRQNYQVLIQWIFGVMNVILNYILILQMGVLGAAIATTMTTILANIFRLIIVWRLESMHPYKKSSIKPVIAVLPAIVGMYFVLTSLNGAISLVAGTVLGGSIYLISIYFIGIEEIDGKVINKLWSYVDLDRWVNLI